MNKHYRDMDTVRENIKITQKNEKATKRGSLTKATRELLDCIEDRSIEDMISDDGDGYTETWRSPIFQQLIDNAEKALKEGDE